MAILSADDAVQVISIDIDVDPGTSAIAGIPVNRASSKVQISPLVLQPELWF